MTFMKPIFKSTLHAAAVLALVFPAAASVIADNPTDKPPIRFDVRLLTVDANEGIAVGDVDLDGVDDIVAGRHWYRGGELVARPVRNIDDWNGYVRSNGDFLHDVDGDGRLDVIAGDYTTAAVRWYQNPGEEALRLGQQWPAKTLFESPTQTNEAMIIADLDGDGSPEWLINQWKPEQPVIAWRSDTSTLFEISPSGHGHGIGTGDLNGDGKTDVLVGTGWYEQPAAGPWSGHWKFHDAWNLHASIPVLVRDVDGDGDNDIVYGRGHDYGLLMLRRVGSDGEPTDAEPTYQEVMIDETFSQVHAIAWVDLDGDGVDELVTGKRFRAHNGKDPGAGDPPLLCYYDVDFSTGRMTRHDIERGRVGTGLQIAQGDFNGDGKVDLAVAGKSGTYALLQKP